MNENLHTTTHLHRHSQKIKRGDGVSCLCIHCNPWTYARWAGLPEPDQQIITTAGNTRSANDPR